MRKAKKKELREVRAKELSLFPEEVGVSGPLIEVKKLYLSPVKKEAKIIKGSAEEISEKVLDILREKRGL